jgi:hypothetical protein
MAAASAIAAKPQPTSTWFTSLTSWPAPAGPMWVSREVRSSRVVWWFVVGLYIVIALIVTLFGGAKRLTTTIPGQSTRELDGTGER